MSGLKTPKPIPDNEADRCAEAEVLIAKLKPADNAKLTTWEVELVTSILEGKAVTRIRLKELREAVHRLYPDTPV